jgi:phenylacetate-CoA ligase
VIATPGARAAQAVATRENNRDTLRISIVLQENADRAEAEAAARRAFELHARLRADEIIFVDELPEDASLLVNDKDG